MSERAGRWFRVSTGGQDEQSQIPEVDGWCESRSYETGDDTIYTVHGGSAFKGNKKFDDMWAKVLKDIREGKITVLVVWKQDRLDRKLSTFAMLKDVIDSGGRVEFVTQPHLNDLTTMGGRIALKVQEEIAYAESKDKSDRVKIKHTALKAAGSLVGRNPYGYDIVTRDGIKILIPNLEESKLITEAADSYLGGNSLQKICDGFNESGRLTRTGAKWTPKTLSQVLRNETIAGRHVDSNGQTLLKTDPIITREKWERVIARMDERSTRKGISQTDTPALLTSIIKCGNGHNMYRIQNRYYYCRRGCKTMVSITEADNLMKSWLFANVGKLPDTEIKVIPSSGHQDAIDEVKRDMTEAVQAEDFAGLGQLQSRLEALRTMPAEPARIAEVETGKTVWEAWSTLDDAGKRQYLMDHGYTFVATDKTTMVAGKSGPMGRE